MTRTEILDCLSRQLVNPVLDPQHCCGTHCTLLTPEGCADCGIVGTAEQYTLYQSLLQDPVVPADQARPLIDALEESKYYFDVYCEDEPEDMPLLRAVHALVTQYIKE